MTPQKRETNRKKGRANRKKGRVRGTSKTPQTRMDKGFAAYPRVRARKNKKKLLKNWPKRVKNGSKTTATVDNYSTEQSEGGNLTHRPHRYAAGER